MFKTVLVPPRINDWNRFEEWLNGVGELSKLLDDAGISPNSADISSSSHAPERDLNQV
jgi:hypothetical protein